MLTLATLISLCGRGGVGSVALALLLATPATASTDVATEWRNLHDRCRTAVETATMLDVSGLESRDPTLIGEVVAQPPFGTRIDYDVLRTSARTVPTGIWGAPGGRFEMTLLEFTTRAGTRAICEIGVARTQAPLIAPEARAILSDFDATRAVAVDAGDHTRADFDARPGVTRIGMTAAAPNPRGCSTVVSATSDPSTSYFRTSTAETAGAAGCGGPSLAEGGLTTHPSALNPRSRP